MKQPKAKFLTLDKLNELLQADVITQDTIDKFIQLKSEQGTSVTFNKKLKRVELVEDES